MDIVALLVFTVLLAWVSSKAIHAGRAHMKAAGKNGDPTHIAFHQSEENINAQLQALREEVVRLRVEIEKLRMQH